MSATSSPPSHTARNALVVLGVILLLVVLGGLFIWRPRRQRRQRELAEAKGAAQDDLLARGTEDVPGSISAATVMAGSEPASPAPAPAESAGLASVPVPAQLPADDQAKAVSTK